MFRFRSSALLLVAAVAAGCADEQDPLSPTPQPQFSQSSPAAPPGLVNVAFGPASLTLWPFTGEDLSGTPKDPISLFFPGQRDGRAIRAALMFLNGDRTAFGFPDAPPFNCTWSDAVGGQQTAYSTAGGWSGSSIQLQCGEFGPIRFHIRLFPAGNWTIGGVHFEVLIPGTDVHEVISWEAAEQLVMVDMLRSGMLDGAAPLAPSGIITPVPSYGSIRPEVFGTLPAELIGLVGGPALANDGRGTIYNVAGAINGGRQVAKNDFVVEFDQVIPMPMCGPAYVHVKGPVTFSQRVIASASGNLVSHFQAGGMLDITPVFPAGEPFRARVNEHHSNVITDNITLASMVQMRITLPANGTFRGTLHARLNVGPGNSTDYSLEVRCNP